MSSFPRPPFPFLLLLSLAAACLPTPRFQDPGWEQRRLQAERNPAFDRELEFLRAYGPIHVLEGPTGARVAVSPKYQGRVMTSAVSLSGRSFGWIHHDFIADGKAGTFFDNYGGEDRLWLGPEAGQFGFFFESGAPFAIEKWRVPAALQEGEWAIKEQSESRIVLERALQLKNYVGTELSLSVVRAVNLLGPKDLESRLGVNATDAVQWVGYETVNTITNTGAKPWTKEAGLLSIWILGQYKPLPGTFVVVPFEPGGTGDVVHDRYFGTIAADRLAVRNEGERPYVLFLVDGESRGRIGLGPTRAKNVLGTYIDEAHALTIVQYDKAEGAREYVNNAWELQQDPYGGDVVYAYNDGPAGPKGTSLGGFYQMETSSPALALAPGESHRFTQRTFHFVGDRASLDPIAEKVLGVTVTKVAQGI